MKSDMLGRTLLVPELNDAELAGCLCCALKGGGRYASLSRRPPRRSGSRANIDPIRSEANIRRMVRTL